MLVVDSQNFTDGDLDFSALAGGLTRSVVEDEACLDAERLAGIDEGGLRKLLRWEGPLALASERVRLLREVGARLLAHFGGQAAELVRQAQHSAPALVSLVAAEFPGFRDHAIFAGRQVFLYKRAQIFVGDLFGALVGGSGLGAFHDIDQLTMFADYRVPALLRHEGILQYSESLAARVDGLEELPAGSADECEIRAAAVVAVERIRAASAARRGGGAPLALHIDWVLWELAEAHRAEHKPAHRTNTINY